MTDSNRPPAEQFEQIFHRVGELIAHARFHDIELALASLDIENEHPDIVMAWLMATRSLVANPAREHALMRVRIRMELAGEDAAYVLRYLDNDSGMLW